MPLPVTGKDALALGMEPGPDMGRLLKEAEDRWIESDFTLSSTALIDFMKERLG